ncbi:MAG: type II secretion system protein [Patescibacteria group bacterium]|nr:type II secretion system protein [Patescibacteria group bacterium]
MLKTKNKKAFTLIEIIIILFVASVGIMASLSLAIRSSYFQNVRKDVITVTFLANEGLDLMKNIRDTNIIMDRAYDDWDGTGSVGVSQNFYKVDYYSLIATSVASIDETVLQQNDDGFYLYDSEEDDSIFKRMITTTAETTASTSVEVHIQWENRGNTYDYNLETILYDLQYQP